MNLQPKSKTPLNLLVTRTDRIGDFVLSTPVFEALRKQFPHAKITCLTFLENRELAEGNPYLDEVILYDKKGSEKNMLGNIRFAIKLSKKKFDVVVHLHATNRMHWVSWLARIPVRIGYDRKCAWALTHPFPYRKKEGEKQEAFYNFDLLTPFGISEPAAVQPYVPLLQAPKRSFDMLCDHHQVPRSKPWVVINPSASCASKRWPASRFARLIDQLNAQYEVAFFVIGTKADQIYAEQIKSFTSQPLYDFSGRLSLGMLSVLLSQSALLISNDSGPVHMAGALHIPVVTIFGRNQPGLSPKRWGPLGEASSVVWKDVGCQQCLAHLCEIHFLCLDAILPEDVLRAVHRFAYRFKRPVGVS